MVEFLWILEVLGIFWNFLNNLNPENALLRQGDVTVMSAVNKVDSGQTWPVGPTGQWLTAG